MKLLLSLLFAFISYFVMGQNIVPFEIKKKEIKAVENSLYNEIEVLDNTLDEDTIGLIAINTFALRFQTMYTPLGILDKLVLTKSLQEIFSDILKNQITENAYNSKLLLKIDRLFFYDDRELDRPFVEPFSYFYFSADLYVKDTDGYKFLSSIDTVYNHSNHKLMSVGSKGLIKAGKKIIINFLEENLINTSLSNNVYSYSQIVNWNSILKSDMPLYKTSSLNDGVYLESKSFFKQEPEIPYFKVEKNRNDEIEKVFEVDAVNKNETSIKNKRIYALVYLGEAYVLNSKNDFCKLYKIKNDFYAVSRSMRDFTINNFLKNAYINFLRFPLTFDKFPKIEYQLDPRDGRFNAIRYWYEEMPLN
jgi:hypothetical protein